MKRIICWLIGHKWKYLEKSNPQGDDVIGYYACKVCNKEIDIDEGLKEIEKNFGKVKE